MDKSEFLQSVKKVSNFIVNYRENCANEKVLPSVNPGYLEKITEDECPTEGVSFEAIFQEFHEKIMPGVTHWASPHFHAYFPAGNCLASITAELLIAGINNVGINWETSPAMNELETVVLNWLGQMMNLPKEFLNCSEGPGGGVFQNTSTEATLLSLLAARNQTIKKYQQLRPELSDDEIASKLVIYTSIQAHSSVERVGLIAQLPTRQLPCDQEGRVTSETFRGAIEEDLRMGLLPCYLVATLGATSTCSCDDLQTLGAICKEYDIWMHVDAAYAGAALVCPELRYIANGLHYASSFAVGLHKWFLMSYDTVAYWLKDTQVLASAINVDRLYLKHKHYGKAADFIHLQIGTGRRFKALKVWMVLKSFGVEGVREHVRRHVMLAKYMEELMRADQRFQVYPSGLGLVIFALKAGNYKTEELRTQLNEEKKIMLTPCHFHDKYVIRFVVNFSTRAEDVDYAWNEIRKTANMLEENDSKKEEYLDVFIENVESMMEKIQM